MAKYVITDASHPAAAAIASRLAARGDEVYLNREDISTVEGVRALIRKTGTPDGVIVSGYAGARATLADGDPERIIEMARENIMSGFTTARHYGALMAEAGRGNLLFLSSTCALEPFGADYAYSLSQGALLMLQREMSIFLGRLGVRVNTVLAAPTDEEYPRFESGYIATNYDTATKAPIHRRVTAEEIAKTVEFLLSDAASGIMGEDIRVDGGLTRHYLDRAWSAKKEAELL